MKRKGLLVFAVLILLLIVVVIPWRPGDDVHAPRFVPGAPASALTFAQNDYGWSSDDPFEGGRVWVFALGGTNASARPSPANFHFYLFDLDRRTFVGELFNGSIPVLRSLDDSRLLIRGYDSPATSLGKKATNVADALRKLLGAKPLPQANRIETFWLAIITNNSTIRLGALSQLPGAGSRWRPSPDSRRGYTRPTGSYNSAFVCDLETGSVSQLPVLSGNLLGWWDNGHILIENATNEFNLLDMKTRETQTLFTPADIAAILASEGLEHDPSGLTALANWNGREYDFYFGIKNRIQGLGYPDGYLLKANREKPALKLLYRHFEFHWDGVLNSAGTLYLYDGESGAPGNGGNGAVFLRDLIGEKTTTVVPSDNKGQYSLPRFYGNEIIYFRDHLLHRINMNGSNDVLLLPAVGSTRMPE